MIGQKIRRTSLIKFKYYLDLENSKKICFLCHQSIAPDELSIHHVIPWSYLYSDDLWNLVYAHKSCNSSKTNGIPLQQDIENLKLRNKKLSLLLKQNNKKDKLVEELNLAIQKDYVNKFWISCKS